MTHIWRSLYLQYKSDNTKVSNWLGNTAINYGFPLANFNSSTGTTSTPAADGGETRTAEQEKRAKKKARAKANLEKGKHGATLGAETPGNDGKPVEPEVIGQVKGKGSGGVGYLMSSKEYVQVATYLLEKGVSVPIELMRLLQRCIRERVRAFKYYSQDRPSDSHLQFINTLQEVQRILEPLVTATKPKPAPAQDDVNDPVELGNRFAALSSDEEDEEDMADIDLPKPPRPEEKNATPPVDFSQDTNEDDAMLELLLFFADVRVLRSHIQGVWTDYHAGKIRLHTAAVTTNTGIGLLRKSLSAFSSTTIDVIQEQGLSTCTKTLYRLLSGKKSNFSPLVDQVAEHLLMPNLQVFQYLSGIIKDGKMPFVVPGHFGTFDPSLCGSISRSPSIPADIRWINNSILLREVFVEYVHFADMGRVIIDEIDKSGNRFYLDEIAAEMHRWVLAGGGDPTLLLLACSQIFLDVHEILRSDASKGHRELMSNGKRIVGVIERWSKMEPDLRKPEEWTLLDDKLMMKFGKDTENLCGIDPMLWQYRRVADTWGPAGQTVLEQNYKVTFLDRNPFFCGLLLFRTYMQFSILGLNLVFKSRSICSAAHLVVAARLADNKQSDNKTDPGASPPPTSWPEFEMAMNVHEGRVHFVDGIPENTDGLLRSFMLGYGLNAKALNIIRSFGTTREVPDFGRGVVHRHGIMSDAPRNKVLQGFWDETGVIAIFRQQYTGNAIDTGASIDVARVQKVLVDLLKKDQGKKETTTYDDTDKTTPRASLHLRKARKHKSTKFSLTQLLSVLEAGLESDTPLITLDWLTLHVLSMRMIYQAHRAFDKVVTRERGAIFMSGDEGIMGIVPRIMEAAAFKDKMEKLDPAERVRKMPDWGGLDLLGEVRKLVQASVKEISAARQRMPLGITDKCLLWENGRRVKQMWDW